MIGLIIDLIDFPKNFFERLRSGLSFTELDSFRDKNLMKYQPISLIIAPILIFDLKVGAEVPQIPLAGSSPVDTACILVFQVSILTLAHLAGTAIQNYLCTQKVFHVQGSEC